MLKLTVVHNVSIQVLGCNLWDAGTSHCAWAIWDWGVRASYCVLLHCDIRTSHCAISIGNLEQVTVLFKSAMQEQFTVLCQYGM